MSKQFGFEHVRWNRCGADGDKRCVGAHTCRVNRACDQFFTRACLTCEQHIDLSGREPPHHAQNLQNRRTVSEQAITLLKTICIGAGTVRTVGHRRHFDGLHKTFDERDQLFGVKRFGDVFRRAFLKG